MATKQFQNAKLNVTHLDLKDDASRSVLQSGENISHSLGKIARWYKDIIWTDSKATTEVFGIVKLSDDYSSESTETVPTSKTLNDVVKLMKQTGGWNTTYDFNSNIDGDENLQNGQFKVTEHDLEGDIDHYVYIKGLGSAAYTESSAYATAGHTHKYAGSDSVGGAATSANKLNTDAGSDINPIYFSNGIPVACTYSLNKTVPSNALFTDEKVKQTATTTDADYEILFSSTADNTTRTEGARKNSNLTFNPSTGTLTATKFVGELSGNATTATTANKLSNTTAIGSSIKPVYFSADGIPVAIDHSIETSVPSNAVFTDTTYTVSSGDSNGQIKVTPSEGDPYNVSVKGLGSAAYTDSDEYAMADHTHKYAGSSSVGGVANSAAKLSDIPTTGIGSETKPVFFSGTTGRPVACTYSLNATVPANAIFTDEKVKQSPVTTDGSFEVLFAGSTGNTAKTEGVGKTTTLTFNPSTGALSATSFTGNGSGLTTLNASNISSGTLSVNRLPGSAVTVGTYGPAAGGTLSHSGTFDVPDFTVDAKGRITGAHTRTFTLPAQYTHPTYTSKASGLYKITVDSLGHVSGTAAVTKSDIPALDYVSSTTTRNPNVVLAGPASGTTAAAPTFRALVAADLPASGATAGSYGPSANATPGYGATFNVPYITIDAKGRVTAISTKTVKIPASDNTNTTYTLSGAYGSGSNTWVTTLTPSSGSATTSTVPVGTTSAYGLMKLYNGVDSTSTALAATANAVKTAYDYKHYIGSTRTDGTATAWSYLAIKEYDNAYPDGMTLKKYGYGGVITLSGGNSRLELYANHNSSTTAYNSNGIQFRTGWVDDKKPWRMLLDNVNYSSYITPAEIGASASDHSHPYLPTAGGTMEGHITFAAVTSTSYTASSHAIAFSGSTDWAKILYEVRSSDAGQLVLQTGDDANARIVFRNSITSGGTATKEVIIENGVITGNGSGLTSLNASNISSGTLSADRLATSGATAGSYGPSANATPGYGSTFNVPYITVDNKGRVTAISTKTVKIPASDNTNTTYTFATGDNNGTFKVTPSGGTAKNIAIKGLGSAAYTASSAYATSGHTHGLGHSNFTVAIDSTTNTWAAIGVDGTNKYVLKSIRTNTNAPPYLLNDFSAGIVFGGEDTRGVISMKYDTPSIRFAGGNRTAADGGTARWYITLTGTHNTTYNLDTMHQVTQTATTTSAAYEVLFSGTADNTTRTEGARKNSNLTFNPSTGILTTDRVYSARTTGTYLAGNKGSAIINSTASAGAYVMLARMHSTNGYFTHGTYQNSYLLQYTVQSTIDAGTNAVTKSVTLLNESGNSSFPGTVTAAAFDGKINGKSYNEFAPTSTSTNKHCLLFYQDKMETSSGKVGADLLLTFDTIQGVLYSPGMECGVLEATSIYMNGTSNNPNSEIHYRGTKASHTMIKFVDNAGDTSGNGIVIGGGGLVVVGAGESANNLVSAASLPGGQEKLYLTSDSEIYFYINCNTIGDRKGMTLNTALSLYPNSNNTGSVGTSSYKWASMYATTFYGAFSGSGASVTSLNASNISSGTLSADRLATSGVTAGSYGPSTNASPAHSGTFNVPYITVDNKGRVMAIATRTITLPASGNTDTKVTQSATSTANFRGVILGTNNTVSSGDTRETTVTGQGYITNKIFAQPSTGNLYASNIYAFTNGTDEVRIALYRSGYSSWRLLNSGGTLSLQNNYYSDKVQSWYNVAQFDFGGTNAIKFTTPPQLTGTNRSTTYGYSTIDMAICSKNSWAMSMRWLNNARNAVRGSFGAYGTADNLTYYYWGNEYNSTKLRLYPGTGGGLVSQQSNGFRIATNGYGVIFRVDSDNFYILLTDKKTDGSELTGDNWNSKRPLQIGLSSGVCNINGTASTAKKLKYCTLCNEASDAATYPWYRIAYAYTTGTYVDLNLVMMVTCGYGSKWGIFKARARTEGKAGTFGGTVTIEWIINDGFTNAQLYLLTKNNYQVDTAKSGTATAEIWFKSDGRYWGYTFTVLHEGWRTGTASDLWALSSYTKNGSENYNKNASGVKSATSSKIYSTNTPGSSTHAGYSIPFFSGPIDSSSPEKNDTAASGNKTVLHNGEFRLGLLEGTTSTDGYAQLVLGNGIASGTAGNKYGKISLYSSSAYAVQIIPAKVTATRTLTLPNASGTVALTSHTHSYIPTSSAATLFSGTAAASITMTSMSGYTRLVVFCKNTSNSSYFTVELQCTTGYHYHAMTVSPPPAAQTNNSFYGLLFNLSSNTKLSVSAGKYSNLSSSASLANGPTVHITKVIGYKF